MPIYEYQCERCGHELEAIQRMSDAALTDCPSCGAATLRRKISAAGFRLKGGGWYETDFKSSGRRNLAGDGGGEKSAAESKKASAAAGAGSDSKPAA